MLTNHERDTGAASSPRGRVPATLARTTSVDVATDAGAGPRLRRGREVADEPREGPSREQIESWLATMSSLRPYEQKAIRVRYLSGLSHAEAAETMGLSHDAMTLTVDRALDALQRALSGPRPAAGS